jgi:hypothetical protein
MSILYWDGFENPDNPNWTKWGWGAPTFHTDEGRDGGSVSMSDTWGALILDTVVPPWSTGYVVGVAIRPVGVSNFWSIFSWGQNPDNVYVNCCGLCCSNGQLVWGIGNGDGIYSGQLAPANYIGAVLRAECWNHVEMHVHAGYITVWVNGYYIPPIGVDFHAFEGFPLSKIALGARTQWIRQDTPTRYFDDFYLAELPLDDSPIGDLAVTTYFPITDGAHKDWHVSDSGADHYEMVNENPNDDADTSYVYSPEEDDTGNQDTYVFGITEHSGTPIDVQPHWRARKTNIGERTMRAIARLDTAESYSDPFHVYGWWVDNSIHLEDYQTYPRGNEWFTIPTDPNDDPWTWENLEICEFGQEIYE